MEKKRIKEIRKRLKDWKEYKLTGGWQLFANNDYIKDVSYLLKKLEMKGANHV